LRLRHPAVLRDVVIDDDNSNHATAAVVESRLAAIPSRSAIYSNRAQAKSPAMLYPQTGKDMELPEPTQLVFRG
jgi:hypothetical protein